MKDKKLRRVNNVLSMVVVMLAMYIFMLPFWLQINWWFKHNAPLISRSPALALPQEPIPEQNTLVIPKLNMRQPILEGKNATTVDHGVWRRPNTATPLGSGNTVLVGHRFTYQGAAVFYHLDKLTVGDIIRVYWEGKIFDYKVTQTKEVSPAESSVEAPTDSRQLTLYTCTPLWTAKHRLVVIAQPIEGAAR